MTIDQEKLIDLRRESYFYELPEELVATRPIEGRHNSKLLVYKVATDEVIHTSFKNLAEFLPADSTLVLNQSKVFPCRLFGTKSSGGKAELFILSLLETSSGNYEVMIKCSGKKELGQSFHFGELVAKIEHLIDGNFEVSFNKNHEELLNFLSDNAQIPIPPYIRGGVADERDVEDYQTVYAKDLGSVAAPTAGLHFTPEVFKSLEYKGIRKAFVTLHVGAGTFKPVKTDNILDHNMHREYYEIGPEELIKIKRGNLIAVGTTSLRVLESDWSSDSTNIFLYPGKDVKSVRGLLTNFHLPESSLIMLVSALIGREKTLELYKQAIEKEYRFFSYGDAMLVLR